MPISTTVVVSATPQYLDRLYSPINSNGKRNNGYVFPIPLEMSQVLLDMSQCSFDIIRSSVECSAAPRRLGSINRLIRDSNLAKEVKVLYGHTCQVCRTPLITPQGYYAEGAHIIPLGQPYNGADVIGNILCLCPNHHVLFDSFAFSINDNGQLVGLEGNVFIHPNHQISRKSLSWHRDQFGLIGLTLVKRRG